MPVLEFEHEMAASAATIWLKLLSPAVLAQTSLPWLKLDPTSVLPQRWMPGTEIQVRLKLLGLLPLGRHTIRFLSVNDTERTFSTSESGGAIQKWDHTLRVQPLGADRCLCFDRIEFEAGLQNPAVLAFGRLLYPHRYRRLAQLLNQ